MQMRFDNGLVINVHTDEDGFPSISIDTSGGLYSRMRTKPDIRPTVEVKLNDIVIHEMFDESDNRWMNEQTTN
jgi:hypothetical protein